MSIDYKVLRHALDPETHEKIRNEVGEEISKSIAKYEKGIRQDKKIDNVAGFTADLKAALAKVLAKHLKLEKAGESVDSLTDSITDAIFQSHFGYSAEEAQRRWSDQTINNYDDFARDYVATTRDQAVQQVQQYGIAGVRQHVQSPKSRAAFFEKSEGDLGSGFKWTDVAKTQSDDYGHIATMLSEGIGGRMSEDQARRSKKHVQYSGR